MNNPHKIVRLVAAQVLLYSGMGLSKTSWSLYLQDRHALYLLSIAYTAMAITGAVGAAVTGWLIDRFGVSWVISLGSVFYAGGLLLRLQHSSVALAFLNGVIMGVGASALISCMRPWMVQITNDETRPRVISYRTAALNVGTALGAALLTPILFLSPTRSTGYAIGLIAPAALILSIGLLRPHHLSKPISASKTAGARIPGEMAFGVAALGLMEGFGLSMLAPYIPLVLTGAQISPTYVGLVIAALAVMRVLVSLAAGRLDRVRYRLPGLAFAQICIAVSCGVAAVLHNPAAVVLLLFVIYASLSVSSYCEEIIQAEIFPEHWRGRLFGIAQSGFLAGDALGGMTGAILIGFAGVPGLLWSYCFASALIAICYPLFVARMREKPSIEDERKLAPESAS